MHHHSKSVGLCDTWARLEAFGRREEKKERNGDDWQDGVLPILWGKSVCLWRRRAKERRHTDGLTPSGDRSSWSPLFSTVTVAVTLF